MGRTGTAPVRALGINERNLLAPKKIIEVQRRRSNWACYGSAQVSQSREKKKGYSSDAEAIAQLAGFVASIVI